METTLFQRTRTIRFKLEVVNADLIAQEVEKLQNADINALNQDCIDLITYGNALSKEVKNLVFKDNNMEKVRKDVEIKYTWLRLFTKTEFYDFRKSNSDNENKKIFSISEIPFFKDKLNNWLQEWETNIECLNTYVYKNREEKHELKGFRKSDVGKIIQSLLKRNSFPFIKEFVSNTIFKNTSTESIQKYIEQINELLKKCEIGFLPTQSLGFPIARASLNYYTIFKNSKELEKQISKFKLKVPENIQNIIKNLDTDNIDLEQIFNISNPLRNVGTNHSACFNLANSMKLFKARAKSKFLECIQKNQDLPFFKLEEYPLFKKIQINNNQDKGKSAEQVFADFMRLNKDLQEIANKINALKQNEQQECAEYKQALEEKKQLAKARGKYFTALEGNKTYFENYVKFCNAYKLVAQKFGHLNARIKGIEKEKIESQRLKYWTVFVENKNKKYIAFIPKENDKAKNAYQRYSQIKNCPQSNFNLYFFESLTHRALEKLCFGGIKEKTNTFSPEIQKELTLQKFSQYWYELKGGKHVFIDGEYLLGDDENAKIKFYKDVLNTQYAKKSLKGLPWNNVDFLRVLNKNYNSFDEFKQELEKFSYIKRVRSSNNLLNDLHRDFNAQIFEITSYDLKKVEKDNLKEHTSLWLNFWEANNESVNYPIRINPQLTIFWRDSKESRVKKYGEGSDMFDEKKRNRYLRPQFTLASTFTENATTQKMDFAFRDAKTKKEQIDNFSKQLYEHIKPEYSYGIDTGNVELATLALAKKDEKVLPQLFTVYTLKDFGFSKSGYLKNGTVREEPYRAIKNLSYFTNKEQYDKTFIDNKFDATFNELFDKKQVSAIDLTTAKVINEKIITNGDVISFINLKKLNAKRKICQALKTDVAFCLTDENFDNFFKISKQYNIVEDYQEIRQELFDFFNNSKKNIVQLEDNINKARKALVGNMIGVIAFLFKSYPGIITMEDLKQNTIEADRMQFEGNLARPLEISLYNKFVKENLIPPIFNEIIQLREEKKITQVGIVNFVKECATSTTCPECGEQAYKSTDEKYIGNKQEKGHKQLGIFECVNSKCNFFIKGEKFEGLPETEKIRISNKPNNPMEYESLDSNDKIAAFNIAKRGFKNFK